jgi:hypothetical protein
MTLALAGWKNFRDWQNAPALLEAFEKLPASIQNLAREKYTLWKCAPFYPSLHFEGRPTVFASFALEPATPRSGYARATRLFGSGSERTRNTIVSVFDDCLALSTINCQHASEDPAEFGSQLAEVSLRKLEEHNRDFGRHNSGSELFLSGLNLKSRLSRLRRGMQTEEGWQPG